MMFLRLAKQALLICLVDIKPNGEETKWQQQDQVNISSLLLNRSLVIDVKGMEDDKMAVLLYDTSGAQDVCINEFLVQNGYCQRAGLGIVKSRDELKAESEKAGENTDQQREPEQTLEETDSLQETASEADIQGEQSSQTSSFTEEEKALSEEKIESKANEMPVSAESCIEFKYKPATLPDRNRFQAGVTFVDSQGYVYAQEVKEGDRTLINIMGSLLEKYGKGEDLTAAPVDATSVSPGHPCVAQFTEDGMWYRAKVVKFVEEDKVEVNYVDFGNSEVVSLCALRQEMPFMEVPQQCLQLVLRGIEPKTSDGHWPPEVIRVLSQAVVGQDCVASIKGDRLPGYPLVVKLFLPDGSDVAQTLLTRGLVQTSPTQHEGEEESPQFYPRKRGPGKPKPINSKRSITETRAHAQMISSREAECVLARTELPGDGIRFDVTITHIERPDCIFIQRVPPTEVDQGISDDPDPTLDSATEELRTLEEIMAKINSADYFKKYTPLTTASEGMLCCARYTEDDMWYRAQVKTVERQRPLEARVVYVDYGTTEVVQADRLRGFPSELLDLPVQSTRCFLADVRPPDATDEPMMDDECWPVSTMEALIQLVAGKKLVAKMLFSGPPASVLLYEHKTRSDGCVEEVSIGLLLAQKGLANCTDYEKAIYEESESGESEDKTLEFQESEFQFTPEDSATNVESKNSSSVDLLEKILAPKVSFAPAKQQLLKPAELTTKNSDQTPKNCDKVEKPEELSGASVNTEEASSSTEVSTLRDQEKTPPPPQPVTSDHVNEVTSSASAEVRNQNSIESSV